jgi:enoyl-CoA hydratase/carnithine racemase
MRRLRWYHDRDASEQIDNLLSSAGEIGCLRVEFPAGGDGSRVPWMSLEPWTRSRAVTVAVVGSGEIASPALEVALCSDLVYLRPKVVLRLSTSPAPPSDGVIWALGRSGRAALARGLLETRDLDPTEAVVLGLATAVVAADGPLPIPDDASVASLTAARDLMRASAHGSSGLALELASFRLLFAAGDPEEGARAFLEKRDPKF